MPARTRAPGGGLDARYEQLRHAALHARAEAFPLGLGVLTGKGVTAWRHALASLAPAGPGTTAPGAGRPAPAPPRPPGSRPRWPPSSSTSWRPSRSPPPARPRNRLLICEGDPDAPRYRGVEGDRRPPVQDGAFVRPPVQPQTGHPQHRVRDPPVRPARQGDRAGLGRQPDHRDRHRPGPVRRLRRGPGRVPAAGRRGVAGPGRDRARPGMLPAGPQLRRLAPAPRAVRDDRHPDLRRRRPV